MVSKNVYSTSQEMQATPFAGSASSSAFALQDLTAVKSTLDGINASAGNVSLSLTKAFSGASINARLFQASLSSVAASLSSMLVGVGAGLLSSGLSSISGALFGGGGTGPSVAPFADGGIVASPTFFESGGSLGLMGERGAEAILPLARGPNGQLGLAANGAGRPVNVTVNIQTQDIESFRRSETQVGAALARAVARGQRAL